MHSSWNHLRTNDECQFQIRVSEIFKFLNSNMIVVVSVLIQYKYDL